MLVTPAPMSASAVAWMLTSPIGPTAYKSAISGFPADGVTVTMVVSLDCHAVGPSTGAGFPPASTQLQVTVPSVPDGIAVDMFSPFTLKLPNCSSKMPRTCACGGCCCSTTMRSGVSNDRCNESMSVFSLLAQLHFFLFAYQVVLFMNLFHVVDTIFQIINAVPDRLALERVDHEFQNQSGDDCPNRRLFPKCLCLRRKFRHGIRRPKGKFSGINHLMP